MAPYLRRRVRISLAQTVRPCQPMQLAGSQCKICNQGIMFEDEATWCAACGSVLHCNCLRQADQICPSCMRKYDPPDRHFVFSGVCPECGTSNAPPQSNCVACGAATRWDTQAEYNAFRAHMKATSHRYLLRAVGELVFAGFCVLVMLASLFGGGAITPVGVCVVGFFLLASDGLLCIVRSRRIGAFR